MNWKLAILALLTSAALTGGSFWLGARAGRVEMRAVIESMRVETEEVRASLKACQIQTSPPPVEK